MKKHTIATITLLLLASNAFAGGSSSMGVGAKVGTLGLGLEAVKPVSNNLDLRVGVNKFDYDATETLDGVDYTATLGMQTISALADFRPAGNGFFVSGGVMMNDNKLNASAMVTAAEPVTIGANTITSGTVTSDISFDDVSPYVGVGYRKPVSSAKGLTFAVDAGVLVQGDPKIALAESTGTVAQSDIDAEIASVRSDVDALKNVPVISLGVVYNF
ncbi:MAG: hypothetical protein BWK73_48335 [Thiothrix lacustris]|uniref:Outer membrane protein beta-barrel domain-containing protein n=1 Tax=Thiothrix lacustris TaxID=525917 RepID=A0A1Y1Q9Q4_9GAMM|nr:MAG: hypothetical protein BWK73_48335 [Thiothrix lacustris]